MKKHFVTYAFNKEVILAKTDPTDDEDYAKQTHFGMTLEYWPFVVKTYCLAYTNGQWEMELVAAKF